MGTWFAGCGEVILQVLVVELVYGAGLPQDASFVGAIEEPHEAPGQVAS